MWAALLEPPDGALRESLGRAEVTAVVVASAAEPNRVEEAPRDGPLAVLPKDESLADAAQSGPQALTLALPGEEALDGTGSELPVQMKARRLLGTDPGPRRESAARPVQAVPAEQEQPDS